MQKRKPDPISRQFYQLGELLRRDGKSEDSLERWACEG